MDQPRGEIRSLTGLRFLAAIAVVVAHVPGMRQDPWLAPFARVLAEGAAGVPFFFILSGFVLTYANGGGLRSGEAGAVRRYLAARVARVYPLHLLTMAVTLWLPFVPPKPLPSGMHEGARLAANVLLVQGFIPDPAYIAVYNAVSWTLSCEMFFYLTLPFSLRIVDRRLARPVWLLTATAVALVWPPVLAAVLVNHSGTFQFLWPFYQAPIIHLPTFLVGVFLGRLFVTTAAPGRSSRAATAAEAGAVLVLVLLASQAFRVNPTYRLFGAYVPVMSLIVWLFARQRGALSRLLGTRPFVYLGEISFSVYMIHGLVMSRCRVQWSGILRPAGIGLIAIGITIAVSAACHRWYEAPLRRIVAGWLGGRRPAAGTVTPLRRAA
jgi:peptidoglycan/LPS O-acetylase OafA/YrhL